jgi:hypothetical protein
LYLSSTDKGYFIHVIGKNGEPKENMVVTVTLAHSTIRDNLTFTLQTDKSGKVKLGNLDNI